LGGFFNKQPKTPTLKPKSINTGEAFLPHDVSVTLGVQAKVLQALA